jgi:hypothetical protein
VTSQSARPFWMRPYALFLERGIAATAMGMVAERA